MYPLIWKWTTTFDIHEVWILDSFSSTGKNIQFSLEEGAMTLIIGEDADYFLSVRDGEVIREVFSKYGSRDAVKQASQEVTQKLSLDKGYLDQHLSEAIELWEMNYFNLIT